MNIGSLGIFITLALLLPGFIISSAAVLLFPEIRTQVAGLSPIDILAVVTIVAFFNGHPVFALENWVLNPVWSNTHPSKALLKKQARVADRSKILMRAEAKGIGRSYYDQTFGEFILFTNTSSWTLTLSLIALFRREPTAWTAAGMAVLSFVALFYVAPYFKAGVLTALWALDDEVALREAHAPPLTSEGSAKHAPPGASIEVPHTSLSANPHGGS
jgi:hypothetical protein